MMDNIPNSNISKRGRAKPPFDEDIVHEYFKLIRTKDIYRLLDLFMDDAIIYEPFSKSEDGIGRLQGKNAIESFLTVAMMASAGLREEIEIEKPKLSRGNDMSKVIAYVTFERGGKLQAKFTFELSSEENCNSLQKQKKIKSLDIQFVK
jgi:ketosteroid isomerase-like protein